MWLDAAGSGTSTEHCGYTLNSITTLGQTNCKTNTFKNEQFEMWKKSKVDTSLYNDSPYFLIILQPLHFGID